MSGIIGSTGSKSGVIGTTELDYEEGTWTPVFKSGGNTMSLSSGTLTGNYVKVGGICQFTIYLNNGTITGTAVNSDTTWSLPFTNRGNRTRTTLFFQYGGSYFTTEVSGDIGINDNLIYIYKQDIPYAHAVWSAQGSGTYWFVAGTYQVGKHGE